MPSFPHSFLICRLKSNVQKNVHKTSIWQRKRFCSEGFYNNLLIAKMLLMVRGNVYKKVYNGTVMNNLMNKMLAVL